MRKRAMDPAGVNRWEPPQNPGIPGPAPPIRTIIDADLARARALLLEARPHVGVAWTIPNDKWIALCDRIDTFLNEPGP